jgi:hypothetical protein
MIVDDPDGTDVYEIPNITKFSYSIEQDKNKFSLKDMIPLEELQEFQEDDQPKPAKKKLKTWPTKKSPEFIYEDKAEEIDLEIKKRRGKWFLDSLAWFDFEDVEQIIKAHIHKKWHQWDQRRSLKPWINKIITNQMKNILRNNYSNFVRPCLNCPFNQLCIQRWRRGFAMRIYQKRLTRLFLPVIRQMGAHQEACIRNQDGTGPRKSYSRGGCHARL